MNNPEFKIEPGKCGAGSRSGGTEMSDTCPMCGAPEVDAFQPRTVYACGSSDYDQRPGTFQQGDVCQTAKLQHELSAKTEECERLWAIAYVHNEGDGKPTDVTWISEYQKLSVECDRLRRELEDWRSGNTRIGLNEKEAEEIAFNFKSQRDAALADVERLREALESIALDTYEIRGVKFPTAAARVAKQVLAATEKKP